MDIMQKNFVALLNILGGLLMRGVFFLHVNTTDAGLEL